MTAPVATARITPPGGTALKLPDGYQSLVTFALDAALKIFEKTITPPGFDGGDAIEQTTMHNVALRTFAPRSLKTVTEMTFTGAYDPAVYADGLGIAVAINRADTITVTWTDGSTLAFFGYLRLFDPGELVEGEMPEATVTITPTNVDSAGNEEVPVMVEVAGT